MCFLPDASPAIQILLDWLDEEEVEGLDGTAIGNASAAREEKNDASLPTPFLPLLRGVFARQSFQPGDFICAVPFVSTLLVDENFEIATPGGGDDAPSPQSSIAQAGKPENGLAFWTKFLKGPVQRTKYQAYIGSLPQSSYDLNIAATPDIWSPDDVRRLEIPALVEQILLLQQEMKRLSGKTEEKEEFSSPSSKVDLNTLQFAAWVVRTRAFSTFKRAVDLDGHEGLLSRLVLIPFLDILNHASTSSSNAELQVVKTKAYEESFYALVARKTISTNDEIRITYGTGSESSAEMLSKYGFLPLDDDQKANDRLYVETAQEQDFEWSTSSEEDRASLDNLKQQMPPQSQRENSSKNNNDISDSSHDVERTILELRIRMKEALLE